MRVSASVNGGEVGHDLGVERDKSETDERTALQTLPERRFGHGSVRGWRTRSARPFVVFVVVVVSRRLAALCPNTLVHWLHALVTYKLQLLKVPAMPAEATPTTLTADRGASSKTHFPLDVKFPVYSVAWTDDHTVVLAGGGGSSRTGVKNRLVSR